MSKFEDADSIAQWQQRIMVAAGALALNYLTDKAVMKVVAKRAGPIASSIAIWHVVNWVGLSASAAVDPDKGAVNWANYYASPLSKISPGKDTIHSNVLTAAENHYHQDAALMLAKSPTMGGAWIRTWMAAYGSENVF